MSEHELIKRVEIKGQNMTCRIRDLNESAAITTTSNKTRSFKLIYQLNKL